MCLCNSTDKEPEKGFSRSLSVSIRAFSSSKPFRLQILTPGLILCHKEAHLNSQTTEKSQNATFIKCQCCHLTLNCERLLSHVILDACVSYIREKIKEKSQPP